MRQKRHDPREHPTSFIANSSAFGSMTSTQLQPIMNELTTTLFGFILGLCGSWLWWRCLLLLKPRVLISPYVLKEPDKAVYRIKLINCGRRQVIELKATAAIRERQNGRWRFERELEVESDGVLPALGRKRDYGNIKKAISPVYYCLIKDEKDIKAELHGSRLIFLTLSARDALSGTAIVQRRLYGEDEIQEGDFKPKFTFEKRLLDQPQTWSIKHPCIGCRFGRCP